MGDKVRFGPFARDEPVRTLAAELQRLERQAREAHAAPGFYSRSILADRSGVTKETVSAWLDGNRVPNNFDTLIKTVHALAELAAASEPAAPYWHGLWAAARREPRTARQKQGALKHRTQVAIASLVTAAAAAVVGGFFTPLGGDLLGLLGSGRASAAVPGRLDFDFSDSSAILEDQSLANQKIIGAPSSSWPSGVKTGSKAIKVVITNEYPRTVTITDIELVNLKKFAAVSGTLFSSTAQGVGSNDLLGMNLGELRPLLRHTNIEGDLENPFFGDSNIVISPGRSEALDIRVYAGAPASYTWQFKVYFDEGHGVRWVIPQSPPNLLRITGYVKSYQRVYREEGALWVQKSGSNFCTMTGTTCG